MLSSDLAIVCFFVAGRHCYPHRFFSAIVPSIIFAIWFVFVTQVLMVEGMGGTKALTRSKTLSEGHRGRIFCILFLVILIMALINSGLTFGLASVLPIQR